MHAFVSFLAVAAIAAVMPGPDSFVVLRTALANGPRAGT
jgi:threonine/homoserine/homoserine lactone efflux protein